MTSIKNLITENPSGLLKMKSSLTVQEYSDNYGFGLKNVYKIFESKNSHHSGNDWFAFPNKTLETLFTFQEESKGDLLIVYIAETMKNSIVNCYLILSDDAFRILMKTSHILKVHQMYSKYWRDHIAMNMDNSFEEAMQEQITW